MHKSSGYRLEIPLLSTQSRPSFRAGDPQPYGLTRLKANLCKKRNARPHAPTLPHRKKMARVHVPRGHKKTSTPPELRGERGFFLYDVLCAHATLKEDVPLRPWHFHGPRFVALYPSMEPVIRDGLPTEHLVHTNGLIQRLIWLPTQSRRSRESVQAPPDGPLPPCGTPPVALAGFHLP